MHFVPRASGEGTRPTTLADAKKLGLFPSVTTILKTLDKPALRDWLIRQAVLAVMTAPRLPEEELDAFVTRVLETESQQDQASQQARDRGTEIHAALEAVMSGHECDAEIIPWIREASETLRAAGKVSATEIILFGPGWAGKADLILDCGDSEIIVDYKTTGTLPKKGSWPEHRMQLAAYAYARTPSAGKPVRTANLYISTKEIGQTVWCENLPWEEAYFQCFAPLFQVWCYLNSYTPFASLPQP